MNDGRQMGMHYVDTGFPYAVNETFTDFFQGLTHVPVNYAFAGSMPDQESVYWSMNMNPYKFGLSGPGSTSYYGSYEVNGHLPRMEINRAEWEYPTIMITEEPATTDSPPRRDEVTSMQTIPEECSPNHHESNSSQVIWQDNIDPDNMTYEELLDLGEAIGTQSRGLSQELIDMLPTSKYKFGSLFKRKNSGKRIQLQGMGLESHIGSVEFRFGVFIWTWALQPQWLPFVVWFSQLPRFISIGIRAFHHVFQLQTSGAGGHASVAVFARN